MSAGNPTLSKEARAGVKRHEEFLKQAKKLRVKKEKEEREATKIPQWFYSIPYPNGPDYFKTRCDPDNANSGLCAAAFLGYRTYPETEEELKLYGIKPKKPKIAKEPKEKKEKVPKAPKEKKEKAPKAPRIAKEDRTPEQQAAINTRMAALRLKKQQKKLEALQALTDKKPVMS